MCDSEKMSGNYTDREAEKLDMIADIKHERAERGSQKEKRGE